MKRYLSVSFLSVLKLSFFPPVFHLTELWVLFISPHLCSFLLSLHSSSPFFHSLFLWLIIAQTQSLQTALQQGCLCLGCKHKFCSNPFSVQNTKDKVFQGQEKNRLTSLIVTRLSLYPCLSFHSFLSTPTPRLQYQGGYPSPHCWF